MDIDGIRKEELREAIEILLHIIKWKGAEGGETVDKIKNLLDRCFKNELEYDNILKIEENNCRKYIQSLREANPQEWEEMDKLQEKLDNETDDKKQDEIISHMNKYKDVGFYRGSRLSQYFYENET